MIQAVVTAIRNLRTEKKINPGRKVPAILGGGEKFDLIKAQSTIIAHLAQIETQQFSIEANLTEKPQNALSAAVMGVEIYLPLAGLVDSEAEKSRLQKELEEVTGQITRLETLLSSSFAQKAPAQVVEKERQKLATFKETAERLKQQLELLR